MTCFCIGPINGQPYCPCRMNSLNTELNLCFPPVLNDTFGEKGWTAIQIFIDMAEKTKINSADILQEVHERMASVNPCDKIIQRFYFWLGENKDVTAKEAEAMLNHFCKDEVNYYNGN